MTRSYCAFFFYCNVPMRRLCRSSCSWLGGEFTERALLECTVYCETAFFSEAAFCLRCSRSGGFKLPSVHSVKEMGHLKLPSVCGVNRSGVSEAAFCLWCNRSCHLFVVQKMRHQLPSVCGVTEALSKTIICWWLNIGKKRKVVT